MTQKYRHKFDRIFLENRWLQRPCFRSGDWCIIGIYKRWFGPLEYEYRFCFFGLSARFWFKRIPV